MPRCCLHDKNRSDHCVEEIKPGKFQCLPEFKCKMPGDPKPGDWECIQCGTNNFSSKYTCFGCGKARDEEALPASGMVGANPRKLYVGNLHPDTRADTLKEHFEKFGKVVDVLLMPGKDSGPYAFVEFEEDAIAEQALDADHKVDGRILEVQHARPERRDRLERRLMSPERSNDRNHDNRDRRRSPVPRRRGARRSPSPNRSRSAGRTTKKAGDWVCKNCDHLNYAHRDLCQRCYKPQNPAKAMALAADTGRSLLSRGRDDEDRESRRSKSSAPRKRKSRSPDAPRQRADERRRPASPPPSRQKGRSRSPSSPRADDDDAEEDVSSAEESLPDGWECRTEPKSGKIYYVNHKDKSTSWDPPPKSKKRRPDKQPQKRPRRR